MTILFDGSQIETRAQLITHALDYSQSLSEEVERLFPVL